MIRGFGSRLADGLFRTFTCGAGIIVGLCTVALVGVLAWQAWPVLERAGEYRLFTSTQWVPKPANGGTPEYGALAFIFGTFATTAIALLLAVPFGVASAAYLAEIAPRRLRHAGAFLVELLAAIPSVVYGFWGLFVLAPWLQKLFTALGGPNTGGNGILAAGLILAVMVLPYVTAVSFTACQGVPRSLREAARALGATPTQVVRRVILPVARPGILAAVFLALGRALGETMAVTMLIGNRENVSFSPFALGDSIASRIANQLTEADEPTFRAALVALGLVLMLVTAALNLAARMLLSRMGQSRITTPISPYDLDPIPTVTVPPYPGVLPRPKRAVQSNRLAQAFMLFAFAFTVLPLFLIVGYVAVKGTTAVTSSLFSERARPPLANDQYAAVASGQTQVVDEFGRPLRRGGLGHAFVGSAMMVGLATLMAVPIGVLAAMALVNAPFSLYATVVRFLADWLAGVPSVVVGIFIVAVLVDPTYGGQRPLGFSGWAGAVALAMLMVPIVVRSAEEAMRAVPESLTQASAALGATRRQTVWRVILPAALPAITTGVLLAIGRVAGETAPLLLTAGNSDFWPRTPAEPTPFVTGSIYTYSRSQYDDWQNQAWAATFVLLTSVVALNAIVRVVARTRTSNTD